MGVTFYHASCYEEGVTDAKTADAFGRAKVLLVVAACGVAGGLALCATAPSASARTAGGGIVLGAWGLSVAALHRLGRAGSARPDARE